MSNHKENVREARLKWMGCVSRKEKDHPVQQAFADLLLETGAGGYDRLKWMGRVPRKEKDNPVQQAFVDLLLETGAGDKID